MRASKAGIERRAEEEEEVSEVGERQRGRAPERAMQPEYEW